MRADLKERIQHLVFVFQWLHFGSDQAVFFQKSIMFMAESRDVAAFKIDLGIDKNFGKYDDKYQKDSDKNIA